MKSEIFPFQRFRGALCPQWLMVRKEIPAPAKLVYARLVQYQGPNKRPVFPTYARLAADLGTSESSVRRSIDTLRAKRLITSERTRSSNLYHFLDHEWIAEWTGEIPSEEKVEEVEEAPAKPAGPRPKVLADVDDTEPQKAAETPESAATRLARAKEAADYAKKKADKQHATNAKKKAKNAERKAKRKEKDPTPGQLEEIWREECAEVAPDLKVPWWGPTREGAIAKRIYTQYKNKADVRLLFMYVIRNWKTIRGRYFKGKGADLPTLSTVERFSAAFFLEASKWDKYRADVEEYRQWEHAHRNEFVIPEEGMRRRYEKALKELESIGLGAEK